MKSIQNCTIIGLLPGFVSKKEVTLRLKNNFFIKNPQMPIINFSNSGFLNL
jgi:hypothetical protein